MKIMFEDLTCEAQQRLLKEAGVSLPQEMRWDVLPIAVVEFEKKARHFEEHLDIYDENYDDYLS